MFSIITPSYNQGHYIAETIDSVLNQRGPDVELIVIDGGSEDGTIDILKSYGTRIQWLSERDRGQSDAINKGLRMAAGDVVAFLNSDDYYLPGALKRVSRFFEQRPDAQWVTGGYRIVDDRGEPVQPLVARYKKTLSRFPSFLVLSLVNFINQPSTFWKRELLGTVGFLQDDLHYAMDYDYWLRIMKRYPLFVIDEPLSAFRIHRQSKGTVFCRRQLDEEMQVVRRHTSNILVLLLHRIHCAVVGVAYRNLKG